VKRGCVAYWYLSNHLTMLTFENFLKDELAASAISSGLTEDTLNAELATTDLPQGLDSPKLL